MGFWEEVYRLREEGLIPRVWKPGDLKQNLLGQWPETTVNTNPANYSITMVGALDGGYHAKAGYRPHAWRLGGGNYQLIEDPEDNEATQKEQREKAMSRATELTVMNGNEIRESSGPPYLQLPGSVTSSEDLAEKLQDVLKAMEDRERYPLRGTQNRYERPSDPTIPLEDWEVKFLEKWDARLNDRS